MSAPIISLVILVALALAAWGVGRPITRGLRLFNAGPDNDAGAINDAADWLAQTVWSLALGLLAFGLCIAVLGLCGWLYAPLLQVLTLAADGAAMAQIAMAVRRRRGAWLHEFGHKANESTTALHAAVVPEFFKRQWRRHAATSGPLVSIDDHSPPATSMGGIPRWLLCGLAALTVVAIAGSLLGAMVPATAGDALCYHLELPKVFLAEHRLAYLPHHENSTFPLLAEMWFAWALAWTTSLADGGVAANLVHFGLGLMFGGAAVLLARPLVGRQWAWVAGVVVILVPGVTNQMTAALNDIALALFTTLSLVAWQKAFLQNAQRAEKAEKSAKWFLAAGLVAGGALGVKYVALLFAAAMGMVWLVDLWRALSPLYSGGGYPLVSGGGSSPSPVNGGSARIHRVRFLLQGAAIVAVVAASTAGLWYVRAAWHRGNPIYPFLSETFGGDGRPVVRDSKRALNWQPQDVASAPWSVTMSPERFGGRGHQLGAVFLAALPLLLLVRRLRGLGTLWLLSGLYLLFWFGLRQNVRFLFPLLPLLAVSAAWVIAELKRFPALPKLAVFGSLALLLCFQTLLPWHRAWPKVPVAVGLESRENYLERHEPTFAAALLINAMPGETHVLSQDYRAFYFEGRFTRENAFRAASGYHRNLEPGQLAERLQDGGYSHLLLAEERGDPKPRPVLSRLVASELAARPEALRTLLDYHTADADGELRRYRLLELRR